MHLIPLQCPMIWIDARKFHVRAQIGAALCTRETDTARSLWLDRYAVTWFDICYAYTDGKDEAGSFMAEDAVAVYCEATNCATFPEMDV